MKNIPIFFIQLVTHTMQFYTTCWYQVTHSLYEMRDFFGLLYWMRVGFHPRWIRTLFVHALFWDSSGPPMLNWVKIRWQMATLFEDNKLSHLIWRSAFSNENWLFHEWNISALYRNKTQGVWLITFNAGIIRL